MGDGHQPGTIPSWSLVDWKQVPVNRAFLIIMIPALLVAAGYILVFRMMGISPGYARLVIAIAAFFGMIYWLSRRRGPKANSPQA
jgi:uncharacterized membrane protein